jgi:rubredoxin
MEMLKKSTVLIFVFLGIVNLYPSTGHDVEVKCPLCDTTVSYWEQISYSIFTYGLDLKPMGAARIPTPIPKCNNCGFVFIEDYFTNEEIQLLRNYIINQNVFSEKENFPDYYYLAFALELLGSRNHEELAYFCVCSVWEYSFNRMTVEYLEENGIENVYGVYFERDIFIFLMQNAIEKINGLNNNSEEYNNMQLIKLDFLRRLSLFNEAKILIENIKNNESIYQGIVIDIIVYQTELIEKRDTDEHYLAEIEQR